MVYGNGVVIPTAAHGDLDDVAEGSLGAQSCVELLGILCKIDVGSPEGL